MSAKTKVSSDELIRGRYYIVDGYVGRFINWDYRRDKVVYAIFKSKPGSDPVTKYDAVWDRVRSCHAL